MRKIYFIIIVFCTVYFLFGLIAGVFGWMSWNTFFSYAGLVGVIASVAGLLSFVRPALSTTDLQELDIRSLRSIVDRSEELQTLNREKAKTKDELENLDLQKKEMELLVRKASLGLFLKEELAHRERRILEKVKADAALSESLEDVKTISEKISALNEQVESDPNVSLLKEIMVAATNRRSMLDDAIADLPPILRGAFGFARVLVGGLDDTGRRRT